MKNMKHKQFQITQTSTKKTKRNTLQNNIQWECQDCFLLNYKMKKKKSNLKKSIILL